MAPRTQDEKLDEILAGLNDLRQWQAVHAQAHQALGAQVGEHQVELFGIPGQADSGLKPQVAQQRLMCAAERAKHLPEPWYRRLALSVADKVLAAVLIGILAWAMGLWRAWPALTGTH